VGPVTPVAARPRRPDQVGRRLVGR